MKKTTTLAFALAMVLAFAGPSTATQISGFGAPSSDAAFAGGSATLDFESVTMGTYTSVVVGDVTITTGTASATTLYITDQITVGNPGGVYNATGRYLTHLFTMNIVTGFRFDFANPVSAFAFNLGATDYSLSWTLTAYDSAGTVLDTYAPLPETGLSNAGDYFGLAASGISYVTLMGWNDVILIDNFTHSTAVPEPASLLLLGSGLFGFGLFRRMNKKHR